jgi:hypothetical protein
MKTTFKDIKEIRKGYHKMPDGTIMKDSDHPKKEKEESIEERVRASGATQKMLQQPIDRSKAAHLKLKVRNVISDLDSIAWKLENQVELRSVRDEKEVTKLVKQIDSVISNVKKLDNSLKSTLDKIVQ